MTTLTKPQHDLLQDIMRGKFVWKKSTPRLLRTLKTRKLIVFNEPVGCGYRLTEVGFRRLWDFHRLRWARHGCMAYRQDLEEVEAAMMKAGFLAGRVVSTTTEKTK